MFNTQRNTSQDDATIRVSANRRPRRVHPSEAADCIVSDEDRLGCVRGEAACVSLPEDAALQDDLARDEFEAEIEEGGSTDDGREERVSIQDVVDNLVGEHDDVDDHLALLKKLNIA